MHKCYKEILYVLSSLVILACNTGVITDTLENRKWVLVNCTVDGVHEEVADPDTHLTFASGNLSGSTGCNRIAGQYDLKKSQLTTEELLTTEMACPGKMEREAWLLRVLNANPTLAMDGDDMLMSGDDLVLTFRLLQ